MSCSPRLLPLSCSPPDHSILLAPPGKKSASSVASRAQELARKNLEAARHLMSIMDPGRAQQNLRLIPMLRELLDDPAKDLAAESEIKSLYIEEKLQRIEKRLEKIRSCSSLENTQVREQYQKVSDIYESIRREKEEIEGEGKKRFDVMNQVVSLFLKSSEVSVHMRGVSEGISYILLQFREWGRKIREQDPTFDIEIPMAEFDQLIASLSICPRKNFDQISLLDLENFEFIQFFEKLVCNTFLSDALKELRDFCNVLSEKQKPILGLIDNFENSLSKCPGDFVASQKKLFMRKSREFAQELEQMQARVFPEQTLLARAEAVSQFQQAFFNEVKNRWITINVRQEDRLALLEATKDGRWFIGGSLMEKALTRGIEPLFLPIPTPYQVILETASDRLACVPYRSDVVSQFSSTGRCVHNVITEPRMTIHAISRALIRVQGVADSVFQILQNPIGVKKGREGGLEVVGHSGTCIVNADGAVITLTLRR